MLDDDYLIRQIRAVIQAVFHQERDPGESELVDAAGFVSEELLVARRLKALLAGGQLNQAENLLFDVVRANPGELYRSVAEAFYEQMAAFSDEYLCTHGFSREEVAEGLADVRRIISAQHPPADMAN